MVPYGIAGRATTMVQVSYLGVSSAGIAYNVTTTVPGIYTANPGGTGQGAILDQNLSGNSSSNPAAKGMRDRDLHDGRRRYQPGQHHRPIGAERRLWIEPSGADGNGHCRRCSGDGTVHGSAPGLVYGVMQVNVLIPATVSSGAQPVVVTVGTTNSQTGVTVAIQ